MIEGCIFDLDGTLLDTLESLAGSFNRTLEHFGYPPHPVDAYRYFVGDGQRACVERCLPPDALRESVITAFIEAQQADYLESWQTATPYAGIPEAVDSLAGQGLALAVLSNKNHAFTVRCMDHFFPGVGFRVVQGYTGEHPHKPDPAAAFAVCRAMEIAPGAVAFVGDTATDIGTAVACGNVPVGVLWGFRQAGELLDAGARYLVRTPDQLPALLAGDIS